MQAGTGPDTIANRQAAYVRRNVYSQLKRAKGVCVQTILGTNAAFLACRLAKKKPPELRSVTEACLSSLVAHDMAESRFAHHTRTTICGCRPSRMSTSMSNGIIAIRNSTLRTSTHDPDPQSLIAVAISSINAHANTTSGSEQGACGPGDTRWGIYCLQCMRLKTRFWLRGGTCGSSMAKKNLSCCASVISNRTAHA